AATSRRVADQEERRLAKDVEQHGVAADGARWLKQAHDAALAALATRAEAASAELRTTHPLLGATIPYALAKPQAGDVALPPRRRWPTSGRWTSTWPAGPASCSPTTSIPSGRSSPTPRSSRGSTPPRWAGSNGTGTSARTGPRCSTATATPEPPPGGTGGWW